MIEQTTLIQCDFDGTVTIEDASFAILDAYIPGKWQPMFEEYRQGRMTVGQFNSKAFSMVNADKESLLKIVRDKVTVREGFPEFVKYCRENEFRFVIISNGLDFYIKDILERTGFPGIKVYASNTEFRDDRLVVRHKGPDGDYIDKDVKAAYTEHYLKQGYRVVYVGDGRSDISPASKSQCIFATGSLIEYCKQENLTCYPFEDFNEVIRVMESWG